ncbi:MAG: CopG family transcriptional regulator [Bryobacteraceae bacterium]
MRTTIDIDEDVLPIARQLARERRLTLGEIVSSLIRESLQQNRGTKIRNGVRLFTPKPNSSRPTLEMVNQLRDGE